MSEMININFRVEQETKEQADKLFGEIGLTMTTALTVFLKRAVMDGRIPFDLIGREAAEQAAEDKRIYDALMVAQRQAADPNTVYTSHADMMAKYRGNYGI